MQLADTLFYMHFHNKKENLQVPFHTGASITVGKQYYCMLQYTKFIKNGSTILATNKPKTCLAATWTNASKLRHVILVISNFDQDGDCLLIHSKCF